ncbi:MAG TPA: ATP-binding cassette domain-containing protein, partial [Propionibacteriaceae bacterium]|nr:ATP-binding cassette domain-containing protein [Propionibacteriaceae bacterium]
MLLEESTVLSADDLTVELGGLPVLRGVSVSVRVGEAVALMGGNGSGKSTLVRTLLGLLPHQRGAVRLFGSPLGSFRQWSR